MDNNELGKRLRKLRKDTGMSQEDVAMGAGIASRYYQRIESGKSNPSIKIIKDLADTLGCSLDDLYRDPTIKVTQTINHGPHAVRTLQENDKLKELRKKALEGDWSLDSINDFLSYVSALHPDLRAFVFAIAYNDGSFLDENESDMKSILGQLKKGS